MSGVPRANGAPKSVSESYYKSNLDRVLQENKQLKQKLEQLERENRDLKKSLYDLSVRHSVTVAQLGKASAPFNIDSAIHSTVAAPMDNKLMLDATRGARPPERSADVVDKIGRVGVRSMHETDGRHMYHKYDLKGHSGAVYVSQFSHTGRLLASGSFDKTARIWDIDAQKEVLCLSDHTLSVSEVCWSPHGSDPSLLTGSFDHSVKEWGIGSGKLVATYPVPGFVQCISFNPADSNMFVVGSTSKQICIWDRRKRAGDASTSTAGVDATRAPGCVMTLENDAMVNALYVYMNGCVAFSGDAHGAIKSWDLRQGLTIDSIFNDEAHRPISCLQVSKSEPDRGDEEGRFMAVNSYDNVLRVYDRGSFIMGHSAGMGQGSKGGRSGAAPASTPAQSLRLIHTLKGHRNKNWPIKSSFFHGTAHRTGAYRRPTDVKSSGCDAQPDGDKERPECKAERSEDQLDHLSMSNTLMLATGSSDNYAYLYDVGGAEGSGELIQRLEGHTDRVYAATFHNSEPVLATCSGDFRVKVWAPKIF